MDGLLGSVYSFGDRLKKRARGLLNDPVNQVKMNVEGAAADMNEAMQTPEGMASMLLGSGLLGKIVYHGSPHRFTRFDSSKIGTGEGAQAYGHGLYLADEIPVASQYKRPMGDAGIRSGGKPISVTQTSPRDNMIAAYFQNRKVAGLSDEAAKVQTIQWLKNSQWNTSDDLMKGGEFIKSLSRDEGNLYKVDLPDEAIAKMLDWDKPLSQQSEHVKKAIYDSGMKGRWVTGAMGERRWQEPFDFKKTGEANLRGLETMLGQGGKAEEMLRQIGIPGIRYLDGGSRDAGVGTSNYVVFPGNEDLLKILEINGVPLQGLLR